MRLYLDLIGEVAIFRSLTMVQDFDRKSVELWSDLFPWLQ